jgi:hypothetical protein
MFITVATMTCLSVTWHSAINKRCDCFKTHMFGSLFNVCFRTYLKTDHSTFKGRGSRRNSSNYCFIFIGIYMAMSMSKQYKRNMPSLNRDERQIIFEQDKNKQVCVHPKFGSFVSSLK